MESLNNQYGFDESFVDQPPELYRCIVCQLVLRDPILIMKCGHRFCSPCLERFKNYSQQFQSELRCPVDRDEIDLTKICEDHGLRRAVGSLLVKCGEWEQGCVWQGELTELEHHNKTCDHRPRLNIPTQTQEVQDLIATMKGLQERLETFEAKFESKDKEMAHLNLRMQEMEERCNRKCNELELSKKKNEKFETEVAMLQQRNEVLAMEVDSLNKKHTIFTHEMKESKIKCEEKFKLSDKELLFLREKDIALSKEVDLLKQSIMFKQEIKELTDKHDRKLKSLEEILLVNKNDGTELQRNNVQVIKAEPAILPKQINIESFDSRNFKITADNIVSIRPPRSTVYASAGAVPIGAKGYYEVTIQGSFRVGWATGNFIIAGRFVGDCQNSYAFNSHAFKFYNGQQDDWGVHLACNHVLGVAINMERGEILYSDNGNWKPPMGVAFDNIDKTKQYFPAITGYGEISVNFGKVDFKFDPPDPSFKKLIDL